MGERNPFLFKDITNSEHWRVSEIILSQCLSHPNRKIIEFTDGPEWTFQDVKIKSLQKAKILKINIFKNYLSLSKILKGKLHYVMSSIVGIDGLYPTLKSIKFTKKIAIANKESLICE